MDQEIDVRAQMKVSANSLSGPLETNEISLFDHNAGTFCDFHSREKCYEITSL